MSAPFRTIQHAANVALAGDHVEIRAGTYHEDVVPAHSGSAGKPIVFEAYNGENVTVTGADRVTGWSDYSGSIYKASMPWTLGEGNDEVFVDGQMLNEARFPNTSLDVSHPTLAHAQRVVVSGSTATLYDSSLTQPAGYWKGALIHITPGESWISQLGTVNNSGSGWLSFSFTRLDSYELPKAGNAYYLTGTFKALDAAGEWYRDPSGALYLRTLSSDNPNGHDVEVKKRQYAFDVSSQHDISIQNINIFAATIRSSSLSSHLFINHISAKYISQFLPSRDGWTVPGNSGIMLNGAYSTLENSTISFSAGDGVIAKGANSRITNNVIHDVAYSADDTAGIRLLGGYITADHNTIYSAGRSGIRHQGGHLSITYNTIHDIGLQTTEAGGTYTVNMNGGGTVIAYNKIYNLHSGGYGNTALFLDNNSSGYTVDNNQVSNVDNALKMNFICRNDTIYNNTLMATAYSISSNRKGDWSGTRIYNNIFNKTALVTSGGQVYNNSTTSSGGHGAADFASGATIAAFDPNPVPTDPTPVTPPPTTSTARKSSTIFQAEKWTKMSGVQGDNFSGLGYADGGDWAEYAQIDFGTGVTTFKANIAALAASAGSIEIHTGSPTGTLVGTLKATATGAWNKYTAQSTAVTGLKGIQDIYLVFKGGKGVANVDSFTFA